MTPGLMQQKILTKIKMQIPACVPQMSPLASILRPCGPYCCHLVGSPVVGMKWDKEGEKEKEKQTVSFEPWRHKISLPLSLTLSLFQGGDGGQRSSLSLILSRGFLTTDPSRPPGLCQTDWAIMNCGTLVVQPFQPPPNAPSPAGFCPGFNIQLKPASVTDGKNKLVFPWMCFWERLTGPETSGRLKEVW